MPTPIVPELGSVLNRAQAHSIEHKKCMQQLRLIHKVKQATFYEDLVNQINRILPIFKREPAIERLVSFFCEFFGQCAKEPETEKFVFRFLSYLANLSCAKDKGVRFRSCQFIGGIIENCPDDVEIPDELAETIETSMLRRLKDTVPVVRAQAVYALTRFQSPDDEDDPVTSEYLRLLETDQSKDVRKVVLKYLSLSRMSLEGVLERLRDVSDEVRKLAVGVVGSSPPSMFKPVAKRAEMVKAILRDRVEAVRIVGRDRLCKTWFELLGNNHERFVGAFDVVNNEEAAELAVKALLQIVEPPPEVDTSSLTPETSFLWRMQCERMLESQQQQANQPEGEDTAVPTLPGELPDICFVCDLLARYANEPYVLRQLLLLVKQLDFSDEVGRSAITQLLRHDLASLKLLPSLVPIVLDVLRAAQPDHADFIRIVVEALSDVREPVLHSEAITDVRAGIDQVIQDLGSLGIETPSSSQNPGESHTSASDPETVRAAVVRSLAITTYLLSDKKISNLSNPLLSGLLGTTILPSVQKGLSPDIRNQAIHCLGLYTILNERGMKEHANVFIKAAVYDIDEIKITALKALFDIVIMFGLPAVANACDVESREAGEVDPSSKLLSFLSGFISNDNAEIRSLAVIGMCKLFVADRVSDPKILANLMITNVHKSSATDNETRQCLSAFFPGYAFSSPSHVLTIEGALPHAIRTALYSVDRSLPPAQLDSLLDLVLFLIDDTPKDAKEASNDRTKEKTPPANESDALSLKPLDRIANTLLLQLCCALQKEADIKSLSRTISKVELRTKNVRALQSLQWLCAEATESIENKVVKKYIEKFFANVQSRLPKDVAPISEEDSQLLKCDIELACKEIDLFKTHEGQIEAAGSTSTRKSRQSKKGARKRRTTDDNLSEEDGVSPLANRRLLHRAAPQVSTRTPTARRSKSAAITKIASATKPVQVTARSDDEEGEEAIAEQEGEEGGHDEEAPVDMDDASDDEDD